jgi:hypothetical protein
MRLMSQIIVFLEILISCFRRSVEVLFIWWANQPYRSPRNRSPSGGELKGSPAGWKGMPNDLSTGLKGGRIQQRAERTAANFGLDEEMLRAAD